MTGVTTSETPKWVYAIGLIPTIWVAILIAPSVNGGLPQIIKDFPQLIESPFNLSWCDDSLKVILIFILGYIMGISIYLHLRLHFSITCKYSGLYCYGICSHVPFGE